MSRFGVDRRLRTSAWVAIAAIAIVPIAAAALNPLQHGRELLWITGGMAGVVAMSLLFVQPLLTAAAPPLLAPRQGVRWHRWSGIAIMLLVALHVGALYAYSPDDVTDALLLRAPTPFSLYGVIGLVCLVVTGLLAALRQALGFGFWTWRILHSALGVMIVGAAAVHALQIDGAMEQVTKAALCAAALVTVLGGALQVAVLAPLRRPKNLRAPS